MALFRRKNPDPTEPPPARTSLASVNEAVQLRGRARRRLVGAVALVLAAVIVLPMALDSEPLPVASDIPIVIPERDSPYQPQFAGDAAASTADTGGSEAANITPPTSVSQIENRADANAAVTPATPPASVTAPAIAPATAAPTASASNNQTPAPPPPRATTATPTARTTASLAEPARSDDGSRALALLEGRAVTGANARDAAYVLQVAAYSSQSDAQARRDQLVKAGVSNAFVESATVNGKPQYRLRVGPFASRADAQAAQPRLRALGYSNGFIAAQ